MPVQRRPLYKRLGPLDAIYMDRKNTPHGNRRSKSC
jgi:hypothetical protein